MRLPSLLLIVSALLLAACNDQSTAEATTASQPRLVRTTLVRSEEAQTFGLSGTVRARVESPLAFQVGGRIARRLSDAGQPVHAGQVLFELDARDLEQEVSAASADLTAANAALDTAESDLRRHRELRDKNFVSAQAMERAELNRHEARTRRDAAAARLAQARNALGYGHLQAPAAGVLIDVTAEAGQVVAAGAPLALLAQSGDREIEVFFPEGVTPPAMGELLTSDAHPLPLRLRETAGAVDAQGRTLRARYTVLEQADSLQLGAVLRTRFATAPSATTFSVPIGAIDERGQGARVWRFDDGRVEAVAVHVLGMNGEAAQISGPLNVGERLVALGTHLLDDGMVVREQAR